MNLFQKQLKIMINFKWNKLLINKISRIFIFLFFLTFLNFNSLAQLNCADILKNPNAKPGDVIRCGSPSNAVPAATGRGLYDVIMTINNTLAILAVFLSIIGVIVGIIYLAKAGANKSAFEDAKGIITNSLLAFIIVASIWIIVRLVLNTFGLGTLIPVLTP